MNVITTLAAGALTAALLLAPQAHAGISLRSIPVGDGAWVCALLRQGVTVPQITDQLVGDPRVSRYQIEHALWAVVDRECGPTVGR